MRVLVTGAAGFIGSHLCERLLGDGVSVRGLDRFSDYYDPQIKRQNARPLTEHPDFELIEGSVTETEAAELLDGVSVVYHLAGQPGVRVSWGREFEVYLEDNVLATQQLLEAARDASLDRFVFASSSSIYGDAERFPTSEEDTAAPVSPYGLTKLAAEHLCRLYCKAFDVPTVALRYFTIFGPRQRPDMAFTRFIDAALAGDEIEIYGDGLQSRDFTYVDDAVTATIAAGSSGRPGSAYNVAGGNRATVRETIETIERLVEARVAVRNLPAVTGDARKTGADIEAARRDLGYAPSVTLEDGLRRQVAAQRANRETAARR
jgi:nucleoside-diphosphate-sugar epimerase